ncbi:uncharacterized protein LOC133442473 [Cololabis saira]|uniref:uncharacterized protein LOC133442473 n=1 Tax=Cololabis saira TaxID=129043 RepID=UPI002AD542E5|nr:uncharacterized protein LOC133442473 [Cololabis saira]
MRNQKTCTLTGPDQNPVLPVVPVVRYHPSIQNSGGGASSKPASRTRTRTIQNQNPVVPVVPVVPEVRYHPSIQTPSKPPSRIRTRTNQTQKTRPAGTRTDPDGTRPDPEGQDQDLKQKPAPNRAGGDGAPPSPGAPPPPEPHLDHQAPLDPGLVDRVEVQTRGQSTNPDWFLWRKNRITASVAHRIANCRYVTGGGGAPPASYLATVTGSGPRVQTRAMSWGVHMEARAVQRYQVRVQTP